MNDNPDDLLDAMLGIPDARGRAEADLLELVRGEDSQAFDLRVSQRGDRWTVTLAEPDGAGRAIGEGGSFTEAWHRLDPWWARAGGNDNGGRS